MTRAEAEEEVDGVAEIVPKPCVAEESGECHTSRRW
jgi:hypothetical protein